MNKWILIIIISTSADAVQQQQFVSLTPIVIVVVALVLVESYLFASTFVGHAPFNTINKTNGYANAETVKFRIALLIIAVVAVYE